MNSFEGKYIIDEIRNLSDGSTHERETRRKGQDIYIPFIEVDKCMYLVYNENSSLRTSLVKEVKDYDDYIQVYTLSTLYQFKKVNK